MSIRLRPCQRGFLAAAALCVLTPVLSGQRVHPTPTPFFAAEWGMSIDTLMRQAANGGWEFLAVDEDGDYTFRGSLPTGEPAYVFATVDSTGGLTRLLISIAPHASADQTFQRLADTLRAHFGDADISSHDADVRPAPHMVAATAWRGVLMGLRRDRRILILFTCPASSPRLPVRHSKVAVV
ncbi:MAG: hypothetical protein AB1762_05940 [Gemmatimonadota bacterium]